jgi:hypothetical protein
MQRPDASQESLDHQIGGLCWRQVGQALGSVKHERGTDSVDPARW